MNADWWAAAYTPWMEWFNHIYPNGWINVGQGLDGVFPTYQGPLFPFSTLNILEISNLPSGSYNFYFGVDTSMNKALDNPLYYESISVNIKEKQDYMMHGINLSPYIDEDEDPNKGGSQITDNELKERIGVVVSQAQWVRSFGCNDDLKNISKFAHAMGMKTAGAAWLSSDLENNDKQIECLIVIAKVGQIDLAIVGSETLHRKDLTSTELIGYIEYFKSEVPDVPVTTADVYGALLNNPEVMDACDVIFVNYYPYWEGKDVGNAIAYLHALHSKVMAKAGGKEVIVSETGWPSEGEVIDKAVPSLENACFYFLNFVSWARAENVKYFYFEAFDEQWKAAYEGPQGAHWGLWDKDGSLKPCMQKVFDGETIPDNWTCKEMPGGPGVPAIEFTYVPPYGSGETFVEGQVWHVSPSDYSVAVYINVNGGWWTKPFWDSPLTNIECDGSWTCYIVTGGIDSQATKIAAYLVSSDYDPPLVSGGALPSELEENSVAKIEVTRSQGEST